MSYCPHLKAKTKILVPLSSFHLQHNWRRARGRFLFKAMVFAQEHTLSGPLDPKSSENESWDRPNWKIKKIKNIFFFENELIEVENS